MGPRVDASRLLAGSWFWRRRWSPVLTRRGIELATRLHHDVKFHLALPKDLVFCQPLETIHDL